MESLLRKMVVDFNDYSELVALNRAQKREGRNNDNVLEWNRGHLSCIEDYMEELAKELGYKLVYECGEHKFGFDDWARTLEYMTVRIEK